MKTRTYCLLIVPALLALMTLNSQLAFAQGTAFTYQGRLNDGANPANGTYDFRFRLASDPLANNYAGGPFLTNGIAVSNGLFTVALDFGDGLFTGSNYWLEVDVKTNLAGGYSVLTPLQTVTPTPYAIFANTASNLSGALPAAQISGAVSSGNFSGTYGNAVTLNNAGNSFNGSFSGNGANVTNVNATTLNGLNAANFWQLGGNHVSAGQIFGSTNNQPVELWVNGGRALRLEPGVSGDGAPNVIGGASVNYVSNGVVGATIGGGGVVNYAGLNIILRNIVTADFGTVSGGANNTASNTYATIGGGYNNVVGGDNATVPGGDNNLASGDFSFAAGSEAKALNQGAFVWADSQIGTYASDRNNEFKIRAGGGVQMDVSGSSGLNPAAVTINSTSANGVGLFVSLAGGSSDAALVLANTGTGDILKGFSGAGADTLAFEVQNDGTVKSKGVVLTSDRNAKANFTSLDARAILAKIIAMPVTEWNYKDDAVDKKHIGPMAQDFHAAFGLDGADDKHISVVDEGGVALEAIQGLNQKLEIENAKLQQQNNSLARRLDELQKTVQSLVVKK